MSGIATTVIADAQGLEALEETWNHLLGESPDGDSIYLTYEWVATWWAHFGQGRQLHVLVFHKHSRVVGIVPLIKAEYRLGPLRWCTLETIGALFCNHIGLALRGSSEDVAAATLSYINGELGKNVSALRLRLVPEDCLFLGQMRRHVASSRTLIIHETLMTVAPYIQLPSTRDGYFSSLSRNMRRNLRRSQTALRSAGSVEIGRCTEEDLESYLVKFFDLHQRQWQSIGGRRWFNDARTRAFYRDVARRFASKGWLYFSYMLINKDFAHAKLCFIYGGKFSAVAIARDQRYSYYRLGHVHTMHSIGYAIDSRLQEFDLSRYGAVHKFQWTKSARQCLEILVVRRSILRGLRLKLIHVLVRLHEVRENGIRTSYRLRMAKKRQERLKRKMGLSMWPE